MKDVFKRNNVNIIGKGSQTLLFLHGYGCDQNMWRWVTPSFEENYKIVLMDLVGCGNSDETAYDFEKYNSLDGYVQDLLEICEAVDDSEIILVGHSISANICMQASIQKPELFQKLVLLCPSPKFINEGDYKGGFTKEDIDDLIEAIETNYLGWSKAIAPVIMGNPDRPELTEELEVSFCSNNPEIAKHFAKVTFLIDNREDLQKVTIPTLIVQSEQDSLASVEIGKYMNNHIKGSKLDIIGTTGHCPHLSQPEETIEAIKAFL